ncbi:MAG: hypothetical protein K0Q47_60 [Sedimentibacter sp.]|jgi:ribA/ribD-fused uncharacterized protein|nr:hypothetical protein [Sedimentibacter sp.]
MINNFRGNYGFLSNFYKGKVMFEGLEYDCRENAFQASKTTDEEKRKSLQHVNPVVAKRFGRVVKLRQNWERIKYRNMYLIVFDCFKRNDNLRQLLIDTGDEELVEENTWGDTYWGVCNGKGENKLGEILMRVRDYHNGLIDFKFIDDELNYVNSCWPSEPLLHRVKDDRKYLSRSESFTLIDRKCKSRVIAFEEIDAWFHDENYIDCGHDCDICLTPIC